MKRLANWRFRYSGQSGKYLLGCWRAINKEGVRTSVRDDGGTMIEYETRIRDSPRFRNCDRQNRRADGNAAILYTRTCERENDRLLQGSDQCFLSPQSCSRPAPPLHKCKTWRMEKTFELAKKEGKVVVSIPASTELRAAIERSFEKRYGIDVEPVVARIGDRAQDGRRKQSPAFVMSICTWAAASR